MKKVCNIQQVTLEKGSCDVKNRCCRSCYKRGDCDLVCRLSFTDKCEHYHAMEKAGDPKWAN